MSKPKSEYVEEICVALHKNFIEVNEKFGFHAPNKCDEFTLKAIKDTGVEFCTQSKINGLCEKCVPEMIPYDEFDDVMKSLKDKHAKARHFVYAYRYLNEFDQIIENSSDDGEPKGTSGKPCLNVLAGNELINSFVTVIPSSEKNLIM